jgi:hypothetical protein
MMVPAADLSELKDGTLNLMNSCDAILTSQSETTDIKAIFEKLYETYKADQEKSQKKRKFENILNTVIFFVSEDNFAKCQKPPEIIKNKVDYSKSQLEQFLETLREVGEVDTDKLICFFSDECDFSDIQTAVGGIGEAMLAMQEQESQHQSKVAQLTKSN